MAVERLTAEGRLRERLARVDEPTGRRHELLLEIEHPRLVLVREIERRQLGSFADAGQADPGRRPPYDDVVARAHPVDRRPQRDARLGPGHRELGDVLLVEALGLELHLLAKPAADLGRVDLEPLDQLVHAEWTRKRVVVGDLEVDDGLEVREGQNVELRDVARAFAERDADLRRRVG